MGWLDKLTHAGGQEGPWPAWAAAHGFEYQQDGSELIGRYIEPARQHLGSSEEYYNVVRGAWRERSFVFFQRVTRDGHGRDANTFMEAFVLRLPGSPRPDLLDMSPEHAFRAAGGELPDDGTYAWRPPDELLHRGSQHPPVHLERMLETITAQLALAPADLWSR